MKAANYIFPMIAFFTLLSCNKFLEEVPVDRLTNTSFFKTETDAVSSVNSLYDALKKTYDDNYLSEMNQKSDYIDSRGSRVPSATYQTDAITVSRQGQIWTDFYKVISIANISLKYIPPIVKKDDLRDRLLGECYFLRALSYMTIARLFGPAPIRTEPVENLASTPTVRAPVSDLWHLVVEDLQSAEKLLPEITSFGRANKGAARMALATAHIWQNNPALTMEYAEKVISSGTYQLERSYKDVFDPDVLSKENIFFIRHFRESSFNTQLINYYHAVDWPEWTQSQYVWLGNPKTFIGNWDDNDLRKSWCIYDKTTPLTGKDGKTIFIKDDFIHFSKFRDPKAISRTKVSYHFPVFRLSEAYLLYAEADIRDDGNLSDKGREYWNKIRRRGYGVDMDSPAPGIDVPSSLSNEQLQEEMLLERGKEFLCEGTRWLDILRFNKAKELIEQAGYSFEPRVLLFPIPVEEINNNEALTPDDQNPGY